MIVSKKLRMGERINQSEMAKQLNASRTPVANALHKLETEGLVDSVRNAGFFVHRVTVKELADLTAFREAIDAVVVRDLIDTISDQQVLYLDTLFAPFRNAHEIDEQAYAAADMEFHARLIDWCDNDFVKRANERFQILNRSSLPRLLRKPVETLPEHEEILAGFKSRDAERTTTATRVHIERSTRILQEAVVNLRRIGIDPNSITMDEVDLQKGLADIEAK